jgi:hypothetical protein
MINSIYVAVQLGGKRRRTKGKYERGKKREERGKVLLRDSGGFPRKPPIG